MYDNEINSIESNAVLVGVVCGEQKEYETKIQEMIRLIEACDMVYFASMLQQLSNPDPATYIGSGKLKELSELVKNNDLGYVVFLETLSPAQLKNIQNAVAATVLDRTGLILEIFARRAKTREARLQVEVANLQYMLPRLVGMRAALSRQGGGSGSLSNKGQGEKQLELDRRHIEKRISMLKKELEAIEHDRSVMRQKRVNGILPQVSLVGYTNAGKSTLMNRLVEASGGDEDKKVFEKDMLFATLDTTIRRISQKDGKDFLLADTVGFVSDLPHGLVKAFRSTLDEVRYAQLLLIVVDASDEDYRLQLKVTEDTLDEIDAGKLPRLLVYNKCDMIERDAAGESIEEYIARMNEESRNLDRVYVSGKLGLGLDELVSRIKELSYMNNCELELLVPYDKGYIINLINENGRMISTDYREDGVYVVCDVPKSIAGRIGQIH